METVLRVWTRWGRAWVRTAPPSAGRRGVTVAGGSRASRPLVKTPGGCIRSGWGRRKEVSFYIASTSVTVYSIYASVQGKTEFENWESQLSRQRTQLKIIKCTSTPSTFHKEPVEKEERYRQTQKPGRQITHSSCRNDPARCDERFKMLNWWQLEDNQKNAVTLHWP